MYMLLPRYMSFDMKRKNENKNMRNKKSSSMRVGFFDIKNKKNTDKLTP